MLLSLLSDADVVRIVLTDGSLILRLFPSRRYFSQAGKMAEKRRYNESVEIGTKVIVYTIILRGSTQTSYVGTVTVFSDTGLTIEGTTGKLFFPWSAIERVTF